MRLLAVTLTWVLLAGGIGPVLAQSVQPQQPTEGQQQRGLSNQHQPSHLATKGQLQGGKRTNQRDDNGVKWTEVVQTIGVVASLYIAWLIYGVYDRQREIMATQASVMRGQLEVATTAAYAAKESADLALAVELPVFVIEHIVVSKTTGLYVIRFGNHGRTPAIILANCLVLELTTALASEPLYPPDTINEVGQDRAVGTGKFYEIVRNPTVQQADWDRIATSETALWAYGFIDYLDFTKQEHREGFCIGFEPARLKAASRRYPLSPPGEVQWMRGGPPAYTYNKARQKDGSYA